MNHSPEVDVCASNAKKVDLFVEDVCFVWSFSIVTASTEGLVEVISVKWKLLSLGLSRHVCN